MTKILEAIDDNLKGLADNLSSQGEELDSDTHVAIRKAFGKNYDHTIIDLHNGESHPDVDVESHLNDHGYKIHDYKAGIASISKKVGNPSIGIPFQHKEIKENIGKVLEKTKAPDFVKNAYSNDPVRQSTKSHGLKILISTNPYATIGKTSGSKWSEESCMNAETGSNRDYLDADQRHETHEAFLIHPDDDAITKGEAWPSNPIARVSLKRYVGEDTDHSIYRPEHKWYGSGNSDFHRAVESWSTKNYPANGGEEYRLHDDLYDDGRRTYKAPSEEDIANIHKQESFASGWTMTEKDQHKAISHAMNDGKLSTEHAIQIGAKIDNLTPRNVHEIITKSDDPGRTAYNISKSQHGHQFSSKAIEYVRSFVAAGRGLYIHKNVLNNKRFPDHALDALSNSQLGDLKPGRLKPHHIDRLVNGYLKRESSSHYWITDHKDSITSDHISKLIDHGSSSGDIHWSVFVSKNFTKDHAEKIADNQNLLSPSTKRLAMSQAQYVHPESITTTFDAINVLKNKNLKDDSPKKVAMDHLVDNAASEHSFGRYRQQQQIPEGSSKYVNDEGVEKLLNNGRLQGTMDKELHHRAIGIHAKQVDEAIKNFGEKYDKVEDPESHPDFENDKEHVENKAYDHSYLMTHHADKFGDWHDYEMQSHDIEKVFAKHFKRYRSEEGKSESINEHLHGDYIDHDEIKDTLRSH